MEERFTARLPDGSRSRVAWLIWMVGGLAFTTVLAQLVIFLDAVISIVTATWRGEVLNVGVSLIEASLVAVVALVFIGFARRRLLMPRETWLAMALPPAVTCLIALRDAFNGSYLLAYLAMVMTVGLAAAWLLDRRRAARDADVSLGTPASA